MIRYQKVMGLDIGRHSAKVVCAVRKRGRISVVETGWVRLPSRGDDSFSLLSSFLEKKGWTGLPCIVGLSGDASILRCVDVQPGDPGGTRQIARLEGEQFNDLGGEETITDCVRMGASPYTLVASARQDSVSSLIERIRNLGVDVINVVPDGVALYNTLAAQHSLRRTLFIGIDLGHQGTDVVVGDTQALLFARRFSSGARLFPEKSHRPVSNQEYETIRCLPGGEEEAEEADEGALNAWLAELQSCLSLFRFQFPGRADTPAIMVLGGAGSRIKGLPEKIGEMTGLDTLLLDQFPQTGMAHFGRFAVANGLALSALTRVPAPCSLLPPDERERQTLRWQKNYWWVFAASAVATMLLLTAGLSRELHNKRKLLAQDRQQLEVMRNLKARSLALESKNQNLARQLLPLKDALRNGQVLQEILSAISDAAYPEDWIIYIGDSHSYFNTQARQTSTPPAVLWLPDTGNAREHLGFQQIVIEGCTPIEDLSTVRAMIGRLRDLPFVAAADLLGDDQLQKNETRSDLWADTGCRLFAVEISLQSESAEGEL